MTVLQMFFTVAGAATVTRGLMFLIRTLDN